MLLEFHRTVFSRYFKYITEESLQLLKHTSINLKNTAEMQLSDPESLEVSCKEKREQMHKIVTRLHIIYINICTIIGM